MVCSEACAALSNTHRPLLLTWHAAYPRIGTPNAPIWRYLLVSVADVQHEGEAVPRTDMSHPASVEVGAPGGKVRSAVAIVPDYFDSEEQRARYLYGQHIPNAKLETYAGPVASASPASWHPGESQQDYGANDASASMYERKI